MRPAHLYKVAEIEAARWYTAGRPAPPPPPPDNPHDYLHLCAIAAWQAIAYHRPTPDMDPLAGVPRHGRRVRCRQRHLSG